MPSGTQVKQDALAITVGRRGILSRIVLRQLRRLWLHVQSAKNHTGKETAPRHSSQGSDTQDNQDWRCPGVPQNAPILITPEEPQVLITVCGGGGGGGNPLIFFWTKVQHYAYWSPWPTFFLIRFHNGTVWTSKRYDFSCPLCCNWDSVLFAHVFLIVPESPSPLLGRNILGKVHASVFMNIKPSLSLPLMEQNVNPRV